MFTVLSLSLPSDALPPPDHSGLVMVLIGVAAVVLCGILIVLAVRRAGGLRTAAVRGRTATVIEAIPAGGLGQIELPGGAQPVRLNARCDVAVPHGATVRIVKQLSKTSVQVERPHHPS